MTSFADSEKRLIAALGRIDQALDRAAPAADAELAALRAENAALKRSLADVEAQLARTETHVAATQGDAAIRAELDLLRSTRAAEIAALDDIMSGLEQLIARAPRASDAPYAEDVTPAPGDVVAFDKSEG
ncbi:hypothetical protein [Paracoccus sp. S1E-3]|uniref:hypothetical protein n=1 Tax=Paracoccus sp. S1E-3 TaxID=2756130 RepID=UPI0015EEB17D|nr:hypothetical protein [Paracoccus sp. S1E-3]MBA4490365.1 hypothetical protein [Paracoccus sp. S1E-3]